MVHWKSRKKFEENGFDFTALEETMEELLEVFEEEELDFSKPLKIGFTVSLDAEGGLCVDEFGILREKKDEREAPLVDMIDFEKEILIVIETNGLPLEEIDVKVSGNSLAISDKKSGAPLKRIGFPCEVDEKNFSTKYNNGVLELRLAKKALVSKNS